MMLSLRERIAQSRPGRVIALVLLACLAIGMLYLRWRGFAPVVRAVRMRLDGVATSWHSLECVQPGCLVISTPRSRGYEAFLYRSGLLTYETQGLSGGEGPSSVDYRIRPDIQLAGSLVESVFEEYTHGREAIGCDGAHVRHLEIPPEPPMNCYSTRSLAPLVTHYDARPHPVTALTAPRPPFPLRILN